MKSFSFYDWLSEGGSAGLRNFSLGKSFERVSWVYACVHTIATTASRAPLAFYEGTDQTRSTKITDPQHPVIQVFNPPYPPEILTLRDLLNRTFTHMGISGQAYWVFEKKKGKWANVMLKAALKPVQRDGNSGDLIGWVEQTQKGLVAYTVDQVLPILNYAPGSPYSGMPPLAAARLSIESEFNISGWNASYFKSGMKNPLLLKSKGSMTEGQKRDIKKEIINYYSGTEGGQSALLLQGNLDVEAMQVRPKDVDFIMGKKLNREEICAIYGVPPALVGIFEYANYSNVKEQRKIFWENTLLPIMDSILDVLQITILNTEFPGITAAWDVSALLATNSDPAVVAAAAEKYWAMGYTPQQIANILKVPELDVDESEMRDMTPVESDTPADDDDDEPEVVEESEDNTLVVINQKQLGTTDLGVWLDEYGAKNKIQVDFFIEKTSDTVTEYFKKVRLLQNKGVTIDKTKWLNVWKDTVGMTLRTVGKQGALAALSCMKSISNKGWDVKVYSLKEYLDLKQIKLLESQLDEEIEASCVFPKHLIEGTEDPEDVANSISSALAVAIHEQTKFFTYKLLGVTHLKWASGDKAHKHLHGEGINLNMDTFDKGFQHPYDARADYDNFHNCRCTTVPVIFPVLEGKNSRL